MPEPRYPLLDLTADPALSRIAQGIHAHLWRLVDKAFGAAPHTHGRCILYAMVVRDVLDALGLGEVHEQACMVEAFNEQAAALLLSDYEGLTAEAAQAAQAAGAKILTIGHPDDTPRPGCWVGHLVTLGAGHVWDFGLHQAARPDHRLALGAAITPLLHGRTTPAGRRCLGLAVDGPRRTIVMWSAHEGNTGYLGAPDYQRQRRVKLVKRLLRKLESEA